MASLIEKLKYIKLFRSIFTSIWFNFHYLPFKQAMKLPILLYKPHIIASKGTIVIKGEVRPFMIRLGIPQVYIYPNSGVMFENWGGQIVFEGPCKVGNASAISVGEKGVLRINDDFRATCSLKLACYHQIEIGKNVLVGWDCMIVDSDFHVMTKKDGSTTRGYAPVRIGNNVWMAMKCIVLKGSVIPNDTVLSACTLFSTKKNFNEKSVISSSLEPFVKIEGMYRNITNDNITYK